MRAHLPPSAELRLRFDHALNETFAEQQQTPSNFEGSEETQTEHSLIFTPDSEDYDHVGVIGFLEEQLNTGLDHEVHRHSPLEGFGSYGTSNTATGAGASQAYPHPLEGSGESLSPPSHLPTQYNPSHYPSFGSGQTDPMQPLPHSYNSGYSQAAARLSHYAPFGSIFQDAESARQFRKVTTLFGRRPYRPPDSDSTIETLANSRQVHVKRIYDAMTRSDAAKDNPNSIAMRRWADNAFYPSDLVEAYAHKVFDILMKQANEGFRGWHHNDYASDDRKGEPEDKNVSCAERLDNIIRGLEEEKTICEDVMQSACQIRMFVNAPRAYARRKEANRHGNSKRGKAIPTKPEAGSRGAKARRLGMRQTRSRQSTPYASPPPNTGHTLRDVEAYPLSPPTQAPYYLAPHADLSHPNSSFSDSTIPMGHAAGGYQPAAMSPPQPRTNELFFGSPPLQQHSHPQYLSSPPTSFQTAPVAVAPSRGQKYVTDTFSASWPPTDNIGDSNCIGLQDNSCYGMDPLNFGSSLQQLTGGLQSFGDMGSQSLPVRSSMDPKDINIDPTFPDYWDAQSNVHPIPQLQPKEGQPKAE